MGKKRTFCRWLGAVEAMAIIWAVMSTFRISVIKCETVADGISSVVDIMLLIAFFDLSRRAVKAGFCFGYTVSSIVVVSSAWFFAISGHDWGDVWLFGGLALGGLLDMVRTYLLKGLAVGLCRS